MVAGLAHSDVGATIPSMNNDNDEPIINSNVNDPIQLDMMEFDRYLIDAMDKHYSIKVREELLPSGQVGYSKPTDPEVELFVTDLATKLGADNLLPLYAAYYSGISLEELVVIADTAVIKGNIPVRLFMHIVKQDPRWIAWQAKKNSQS